MCRELNCKPDTLSAYLQRWGIVYAGKKSEKGRPSARKKSAHEYLFDGSLVKTHTLKLKLLEEGVKEHVCERCRNRTWLNGPIPLELHHENGDSHDNRLGNLQLLCPNCHALTDNHAGRGKRALVSQRQRTTA